MGNSKLIAIGFYLGIATFGLISFSAQKANATIMAEDLLEVVGIDTFITRDTVAELDWLDLDITVSTSFNSINLATTTFASLGNKNPITDLGFRHATVIELLTLYFNAGIPAPNSGFTTANFSPVNILKELLGPTGNIGNITEFTDGILGDETSPGLRAWGRIQECNSSEDNNCVTGPGLPRFLTARASTFVGFPDTDPFSSTGHFLVRNSPNLAAIPEAPTLALFGLGLAGLCFARRRKAA